MKEKVLLPYLHCFSKVASFQSFTKAAENLHISQSSVSYQIRLLEDLLGISLFKRRKRRKLTLTPAGKMLDNRCQSVFFELNQTLDAVQGKILSGSLTIASTTCFGALILPQAITRLRALYPSMRTHLRLSDKHVDFRAEQIDMAFRTVSSGHGLINQPLLKIPMRIVASRHYAESVGLPNSLDELQEHNILMVEVQDRDWHSLREHKPEVPALEINVSYIDSIWGILASVKAGLGLAYLPLYTINESLQNSELVEVLADALGDSHIIFYLCTPHNINDSPKVKAALEVLREQLNVPGYNNKLEWLS